MTKAQKIIKYFAISLAVVLIVSIFYTILGIISNIFGFTINSENNEYKTVEVSSNIEVLDLEIDSSMLTIKNGDIFKIEYNNENVKIKESNNKLSIKERNTLFNNNTNDEIIIYVPMTKYFNEVAIEAGAGKVDIDLLNTNSLDFELGAGAINIKSLNVNGRATIEAGAGALYIDNSAINNLDLDMGVGKTVLNTKLTGTTDIDAGIGELEINLSDSIDNYNFIIDKGIGNITINGSEVSNNYVSGTGANKIDIDGGIGSIKVTTKSIEVRN